MTQERKKEYWDAGKIVALISCTMTICFYLGDIKTSIARAHDRIHSHDEQIRDIKTDVTQLKEAVYKPRYSAR